MDHVTVQWEVALYVVNIHEAKARLSELVRRALDGEEVVLARRNKPLVRLQVLDGARRGRERGVWKGLVHLADDFDAPLDDFGQYR